jgi:hypothetical protein
MGRIKADSFTVVMLAVSSRFVFGVFIVSGRMKSLVAGKTTRGKLRLAGTALYSKDLDRVNNKVMAEEVKMT